MKYKKRENILFGKEYPSGIYYIVKGAIRTIFLSKDGRELTNTLLGSHDLFPILWVLFGNLPQHTFQAITETELKKAPKEDFLTLIRENPEISHYTLTQVINRLEGVASRFEATLLGNAYVRVVTVLIFVADNLGTWQNGNVVIHTPLTHQEIADMAGLTRETVTIEMDRLKNEGLVRNTQQGLILLGELIKERLSPLA